MNGFRDGVGVGWRIRVVEELCRRWEGRGGEGVVWRMTLYDNGRGRADG